MTQAAKTPEQIEATAAMVEQIMKTGTPIYQVKGLTKKHLEARYAYGFNLYNASKFAEAEKIFLALCLYDYSDVKFWMALGGAAQAQKEYDRALQSYSYAAMLDQNNPMPALRGFECHAALKNYTQALSALEAVIYISGDNEKFAEVKKKAEQLREAIEAASKAAEQSETTQTPENN